jgi:hypothetical protein
LRRGSNSTASAAVGSGEEGSTDLAPATAAAASGSSVHPAPHSLVRSPQPTAGSKQEQHLTSDRFTSRRRSSSKASATSGDSNTNSDSSHMLSSGGYKYHAKTGFKPTAEVENLGVSANGGRFKATQSAFVSRSLQPNGGGEVAGGGVGGSNAELGEYSEEWKNGEDHDHWDDLDRSHDQEQVIVGTANAKRYDPQRSNVSSSSSSSVQDSFTEGEPLESTDILRQNGALGSGDALNGVQSFNNATTTPAESSPASFSRQGSQGSTAFPWDSFSGSKEGVSGNQEGVTSLIPQRKVTRTVPLGSFAADTISRASKLKRGTDTGVTFDASIVSGSVVSTSTVASVNANPSTNRGIPSIGASESVEKKQPTRKNSIKPAPTPKVRIPTAPSPAAAGTALAPVGAMHLLQPQPSKLGTNSRVVLYSSSAST